MKTTRKRYSAEFKAKVALLAKFSAKTRTTPAFTLGSDRQPFCITLLCDTLAVGG